MDVEASASTKEQEAEERKIDHGDYASEPQDDALSEKNKNVFTNLADPELPDNMANPTSVTSSPQSFSVNRKVTEADMKGGATMQIALEEFDSGVEQSDDSTICLNFIKQEGKSDKTFQEKLSAPSKLSEDASPDCEASTEISETTDASFCNMEKELEGSSASQDNCSSRKPETRSVKEHGDMRSKETGTIGAEGSSIGEAILASAKASPQAESRSLLFSPTDTVIQMIELQIRFIMMISSVGLLITKYTFAAIFKPIETISHAKAKITEALSFWYSIIMEVNEFILEGMARLGPLLRKAASKWLYCVLVGTYITILLSFLLLPALLLDFLLINRLVEEPIRVQETLRFNYSLPHPSAVVSLFPSQEMSIKAHLAGVEADGILSPQVIRAASHKIDVTVFLKMPESDHNIRLGMFQVSAELFSLTGQSLVKFNQPCMLRYYSNPVRFLRSVLMAVPTFLGLYAETQTQVIRPVINTSGDLKTPVGSIKICLEPRAGLLVGGGLPEIYSAKVLVQSKLPGLKSIVYKCKLLIFLWIALILFGMEVAFLLCCCRQIFVPKLLLTTKSTNLVAGDTIPTS